jgi:hypothetical protein
VAGWQVKSSCHDGWWQADVNVGDSVPNCDWWLATAFFVLFFRQKRLIHCNMISEKSEIIQRTPSDAKARRGSELHAARWAKGHVPHGGFGLLTSSCGNMPVVLQNVTSELQISTRGNGVCKEEEK